MGRNEIIVDADRCLEALVPALRRGGRRVLGPRRRGRAVVIGEITAPEDLARGWVEERAAGSYRLSRREPGPWFAHGLGQDSWKRWLHVPLLELFAVRGGADDWRAVPATDDYPETAFLGVRPCDLAAMAVQDGVFLNGPFRDPHYARRRERSLVIAVNCTSPGGTCFCASLGSGPGAGAGFDLALTEVCEGDGHYFLAEAGSPAGGQLLAALPGRADSAAAGRARELVAAAAGRMGRALRVQGVREMLYDRVEAPHWREVADRCLACGNCTLVCPTCFCHAVYDGMDLDGGRAWRGRRWDTCYTGAFSYIHGGSVRLGRDALYRQWLTHKLAAWQDQFGRLGCVGCGRCIAWCPVGIDLTRETAALGRAAAGRTGDKP